MTTINPVLFKKDDELTIKIDQGDHYYMGIVKPECFPNDLTDHIQLVENAIKGYKTDSETITGELCKGTDNINKCYRISYSIKYGLFNKKFTVDILMTFHKKEQMDYINERFAELDTKVKFLNDENEKLRKEIVDISKRLDDESEPYSDEEEQPKTKTVQPVVEQATSKRRSRLTT